MTKLLFFRGLKENTRGRIINIFCVLMITMLPFACAGTNKMQPASNTNDTAQTAVKNEAKNSKTVDVNTIECRTQAVPGSLFKRRVCMTKEEWEKKREYAERLHRDADRSKSLSTGSITDVTDNAYVR